MALKTRESARSILTVHELADYLRVHRATIYRLLKENRIPAFRVGSDWRFSQQAIVDWQRKTSLTFTSEERLAHWITLVIRPKAHEPDLTCRSYGARCRCATPRGAPSSLGLAAARAGLGFGSSWQRRPAAMALVILRFWVAASWRGFGTESRISGEKNFWPTSFRWSASASETLAGWDVLGLRGSVNCIRR